MSTGQAAQPFTKVVGCAAERGATQESPCFVGISLPLCTAVRPLGQVLYLNFDFHPRGLQTGPDNVGVQHAQRVSDTRYEL